MQYIVSADDFAVSEGVAKGAGALWMPRLPAFHAQYHSPWRAKVFDDF